MKKKGRITLLIVLVILVIILNVFLFSKLNKPDENGTLPAINTCAVDSECVPQQCCHPTSCININYKQVCNLLCTKECSGPIDCGAGSCGCVQGKCAVISS